MTPTELRAHLDALPTRWEWTEGVIVATQEPRLLGTLPARVGIVELRGNDEMSGLTYLGLVSPDLLTAAALTGQVLATILAAVLPDWPASERWLAHELEKAAASRHTTSEVQVRRGGWQIELRLSKQMSQVRLVMERV